MFLIDTHCHINKRYYPNGLKDVFKNALDNDVKGLIFASSNIESSKEALEIAQLHNELPEIKTLAGIHPHEAKKVDDDYIAQLEKIAINPEVVAVGEIGLDYFYDNSPREIQKKVFVEQIELARKMKKPICLHIRNANDKTTGDAYFDTLEILREAKLGENSGVVHCFSGDVKNAKDMLDLGFYISFAGPITYPKNQELREIAMGIPLDRILCETDSPYLAPQKYRGRVNEPAHVRIVYEMIAMLKGLSVEEFSKSVFENVERVF